MSIGKHTVTFNASLLRILLSVSLVIVIALSGVGFTLAYQHLHGYAVHINHRKVDAEASSTTISSLQDIERRLEASQSLTSKVERLRASASSPNPKFTIVDQVQAIADQNNIRITGFSYGEGTGEGAEATTTPPAADATTEPPAAGADTTSNVIALTANISSPVNYRNYLQFLSDIEQNLPKMQIKSVGVSGGSAQSGDETTTTTETQTARLPRGSVNVEPLVIEMYIKQEAP